MTFTIAELFEKVWETPMVKLAQDIVVSDVAVAKGCRKAGTPLPGRGYWAKQEKQRPRKPKLPAIEGEIQFQVLDRAPYPLQITQIQTHLQSCGSAAQSR